MLESIFVILGQSELSVGTGFRRLDEVHALAERPVITSKPLSSTNSLRADLLPDSARSLKLKEVSRNQV